MAEPVACFVWDFILSRHPKRRVHIIYEKVAGFLSVGFRVALGLAMRPRSTLDTQETSAGMRFAQPAATGRVSDRPELG